MSPTSQNTALQPRRVLVVNDEAASRDTLCARWLQTISSWSPATLVVDMLHRMPELAPDVILLDVMLPDMDGYEVSRTLKQSSSYRHIPVILVTALDSVQDRCAAWRRRRRVPQQAGAPRRTPGAGPHHAAHQTAI